MIDLFKDEYRWLSNFELVDIVFMGRVYPSVEHAYMSAKSSEIEWKEKCQDRSTTPGKIKTMSKSIPLVPDWGKKKKQVMYLCLNAKFNQEPYKSLLLGTGETPISEGNHWGDTFWGVDLSTGNGQNILGKMIMSIRDELRYSDTFIIGFTGTRKGMSNNQISSVTDYLQHIVPSNEDVLGLHGGCIGADSDFHKICGFFGIPVEVHPGHPKNNPKCTKFRANLYGGHKVYPSKPFLERNKDIVKRANVMLASPRTHTPSRGGTWSTINVANNLNKECLVFVP